MGGKGSPPPAPDYTGAAKEQAAASRELTDVQNWANRPTQNTPWGSTSWSANAAIDPATGKPITQWTQNTTLNPQLQGALNDQLAIQAGKSDLAQGFMGRVANEFSQPFNWNGLPQTASLGQAPSLNAGVADYAQGLRTGMNPMMGQVQRGLRTGDNPDLPQFDSAYRDRVATQLMEKMQPVHDYQTRSMETKLANQGLRPGSEAYNRAMTQLGQQQALERYNALDASGQEAQRLYNMQMGARQQAFNEDVGSGQFANQATGQAFNQGLQAFQFGNQALGQASALDIARQQANNQALQNQFGMNQQAAQFQNQLRQQAIAEQAQRRGMSLNEMNALLSGQQVAMPQMPSFVSAQRSETPQLVDAMGRTYDAQLGAYNAQNAGFNNLLGAGAQLGAAYMMAPAGSAGANLFSFSDRRLKSNLKRVGTHEIGVGIYEYTMMGMPQRGVIAQEVEVVRPDLVKRHANGFLMVNYGGL
jgi:hypothetical protein